MDETTRLALAAAQGDRIALDALIRATQVEVWRFCVHLGDRSAADDLTQETYAAEVCEVAVGTSRSRVARARDDLIAALGHAASG